MLSGQISPWCWQAAIAALVLNVSMSAMAQQPPYDVFPPGGEPIRVKGEGTLTYDAFGNLAVDGVVDDADLGQAVVAEVAVHDGPALLGWERLQRGPGGGVAGVTDPGLPRAPRPPLHATRAGQCHKRDVVPFQEAYHLLNLACPTDEGGSRLW